MGADSFARYDRDSGKRDRRIPGDVRKKRTSEVAADVVDLSSWILYGHEFSGGRRHNVVRSGVVVLPAVPSVRTVRVCEWTRAPGFLCDSRLPGFLSWRCPGQYQGQGTRGLCQGSVCGPESRRLDDHPRAHGGRGGGWQDTGRSFRSTCGASLRTPEISRRRPPDDETYGVWVESDNSDRKSRCVENDGINRRQEPRAVCVVLGADRGSYQASRAGNARVANPASRPVKVSGVYG